MFLFHVELRQEEDGRWSVWVPGMAGFASWGRTKEEALRNIQEAAEVSVTDMVEAGETVSVDGDAVMAFDRPMVAVIVSPRSPPTANFPSLQGPAILVFSVSHGSLTVWTGYSKIFWICEVGGILVKAMASSEESWLSGRSHVPSVMSGGIFSLCSKKRNRNQTAEKD